MTKKRNWISPEDRELWEAAEARYLKWCEEKGVEPYICPRQRCDNHLPCRKHPPEYDTGE